MVPCISSSDWNRPQWDSCWAKPPNLASLDGLRQYAKASKDWFHMQSCLALGYAQSMAVYKMPGIRSRLAESLLEQVWRKIRKAGLWGNGRT